MQTSKNSTSLAALTNSTNAPIGAMPASDAVTSPHSTVAFCGVFVLESTVLKKVGSSPSRAMAKRIRVMP